MDSEQTESERLAAMRVDALLKLKEAERAWGALFGALPVGQHRIEAAAVFERIRCATRGPF